MSSAMNSLNTSGVKGADCYTSTGKTLCDLYAMLNRGLASDYIKESLTTVFTTGADQDKIDALILMFQTRDIRGGKGERDLFRAMFSAIWDQRPAAAQATLDLQ